MTTYETHMTASRQRPHTIYRLYDADDVLLYLGCTSNLEQRMRQHGRKPWWPRVASCTLEGPFDGVTEGRRAEDACIDDEKPLYALNSRQVGERAAAATHAIGPDGMSSLTRFWAARREVRERDRIWVESRKSKT